MSPVPPVTSNLGCPVMVSLVPSVSPVPSVPLYLHPCSLHPQCSQYAQSCCLQSPPVPTPLPPLSPCPHTSIPSTAHRAVVGSGAGGCHQSHHPKPLHDRETEPELPGCRDLRGQAAQSNCRAGDSRDTTVPRWAEDISLKLRVQTRLWAAPQCRASVSPLALPHTLGTGDSFSPQWPDPAARRGGGRGRSKSTLCSRGFPWGSAAAPAVPCPESGVWITPGLDQGRGQRTWVAPTSPGICGGTVPHRDPPKPSLGAELRSWL